jgi:hypothetical protein
MRGLPWVSLESANADRMCASITISSRWRRLPAGPSTRNSHSGFCKIPGG